jgi:molybdenum cofactor guanylyltransferase
VTTGRPPIAAAVLVGGRSTRMGRDKAGVNLGGTTLLGRVLATLASAGLDDVVTVGGGPGPMAIADHWPGEGPLGGVLTALAARPEHHVLVVAVDLPFLDAHTIRALLDTSTDGDADVVIARTDRLEPLCARWLPSAEPTLRAAFGRGERSIRRTLGLLRVHAVDVDPAALVDVDDPEALDAAAKRLTEESGDLGTLG